MGAVLAREVVVTSMAISTMEDSREKTPMVITMDNTATTQKPRRISHTSPVSSARRLDNLQTIALRRSPMSLPRPIHFRKDR
jgi:hypothetical protein